MRVIRLDNVDSTMLEARRRLQAGELPPFTVIAETQSGGVGRLGRPWSSPRGGWWLTTAVALPRERPALADHTVLDVALWVRTVCEGTLGATMGGAAPAVRIKWPNDIMVDDLKLAGVLIEVVPTARAVVALVGVGVNADVNTADLDAGVRHRATSIRELARTPLPPELAATAPELLSRKLQSAIEWPGAAVTTVPSVRERLWGVGRMVPITLPGGARVMGRIDGITDAGHLLATISGEQHTFRSVDHLG